MVRDSSSSRCLVGQGGHVRQAGAEAGEGVDGGEAGEAGLRREVAVHDGGVAGLDARNALDDRLGHAHAWRRHRAGDVIDADDVRLLVPDHIGVDPNAGAEGLDGFEEPDVVVDVVVTHDHHEVGSLPPRQDAARAEVVHHLDARKQGDLLAQVCIRRVRGVDEDHVLH